MKIFNNKGSIFLFILILTFTLSCEGPAGPAGKDGRDGRTVLEEALATAGNNCRR